MKLNIGSRNVRHINKNNSQTKNAFIRYFMQQRLDLLSLQDTVIQEIVSLQFLEHQCCAYSRVWSKYCGFLNFSPLVRFDTLFIACDGRAICVQIRHGHNSFTLCNIFNIYAPANYHDLFQFFKHQIMPLITYPSLATQLDQTFIMGGGLQLFLFTK